MTDRNPTQPDLLDTLIQSLSSGQPNPPANLDPALASVAIMLSAELTPPDPSGRFVQALEQRLTSTVEAGQSQSPTLLPSGESELSVTQTDAGWNVLEAPPRSRFSEFARLTAAVLAIMLIGSVLIYMFSGQDGGNSNLAGSSPSTYQPAELLISWDPNGGEDYKLFTVPTGSGDARKLTPGRAEPDGVAERSGVWSPDGQQVAYVRQEDDTSDIFLVGVAPGSVPVNLTDSAAADTSPVWSPSGDRIAWVSSDVNDGLVANVFTMNADGSDVQQLTHVETGAFSPAWSPDGTRIAYVLRQMDHLTVWVMNADGSDAQAVTDMDDTFTLQESFTPRLAWSPDGNRIAFGTGVSIRVVTLDSGDIQYLTDNNTIAPSHPHWSPDGESIAYLTTPIDGGDNAITVATPGGSTSASSKVTYVGSPTWSPDGKQLAIYVSGVSTPTATDTSSQGDTVRWHLRIMEPDGENPIPLPINGSLDTTLPPEWNAVDDDGASETVQPPTLADPTPVDDATSTSEILTSPPVASMTYEDQKQTHSAHRSCWPSSLDGEEECTLAARDVPPSPAIHVPVGATINFEVEGNHPFTPLGAEAVRLVSYPEPSSEDLTFDFPGETIPFEQGPDGAIIIANVPEGDYSFEIDIAMDVYPDHDGNASYAFRVVVGDPDSAEQDSGAPDAWLGHEGGTQRGVLADACGWPGHPEELGCADLAGIVFPQDVLDIPQDTTMEFSIDDMTGANVISLQAHAYNVEAETIDEMEGQPFLEFPTSQQHELETSWSETNMTVTANLPPGAYVVAVHVGLPSEGSLPVDGQSDTTSGTATYTFHIQVTGDEPEPDSETDIDPFTPAFLDAEVVHVMAEVTRERNGMPETSTIETWIDQTSGDEVSYYRDADGQLMQLQVKEGLTTWDYDELVSHLQITTVVDPDDLDFPSPSHHLNLFRSFFQNAEQFSEAGIEVDEDTTFEGQPAVRIRYPLSNSADESAEIEAYLQPDTLFPIAIVESGEVVQRTNYPTIETLERNAVADGTFSPEIPEADNTYIKERMSVETAREFSDHPVWWLGEEVAGYHVQSIDHSLNTTAQGISPTQHVFVLYRPSTIDPDIGFQVLSQPPLSDQEEASRSPARNSAREIIFVGNRGWVWDDPSG